METESFCSLDIERCSAPHFMLCSTVLCKAKLKPTVSDRNSGLVACIWRPRLRLWNSTVQRVVQFGEHIQRWCRFGCRCSLEPYRRRYESLVRQNKANGLIFSAVQPLSISRADLLRIGAPLDSVELPAELGGGYLASVEAIHQLHCLNLLREASYWDYYKTKATAWEDSPGTLRLHIGKDETLSFSSSLQSTLTMLPSRSLRRSLTTESMCSQRKRRRELTNIFQLMCDADGGLFTFVWVKKYKQPYPIFSR